MVEHRSGGARQCGSAAWRCALLAVLGWVVSGCVLVRLSSVETAPGFDWDALKRDEIVMTPLLDLRADPKAPPGDRGKLAFFEPAAASDYAQRFKQRFSGLRHDVRVFGAGGAFEHLEGAPDLSVVAQHALAKEPLADEALQRLRAGSQDIRFLFVFALTDEALSYDFHADSFSDKRYYLKTYTARRTMTVRMALFDLVQNKTQWLGTDVLAPESSYTVRIRKPHARDKRGAPGGLGVAEVDDINFGGSFESEWREHRQRFPTIPDREPALSGSFDDFALSLPIAPSEEKLIEYTHFTYHRPAVELQMGTLGTHPYGHLSLLTSSLLYRRLRIGGLLGLPIQERELADGRDTYIVSSAVLALSADTEWELDDELRLDTGAYLGTEAYSVRRRSAPDLDEDGADVSNQSDGTVFLAPRAQLWFGPKTGLNYGLGAMYRFIRGVDAPPLKRNLPSRWAIELAVGGTFRGF